MADASLTGAGASPAAARRAASTMQQAARGESWASPAAARRAGSTMPRVQAAGMQDEARKHAAGAATIAAAARRELALAPPSIGGFHGPVTSDCGHCGSWLWRGTDVPPRPRRLLCMKHLPRPPYEALSVSHYCSVFPNTKPWPLSKREREREKDRGMLRLRGTHSVELQLEPTFCAIYIFGNGYF